MTDRECMRLLALRKRAPRTYKRRTTPEQRVEVSAFALERAFRRYATANHLLT